MRPWPSEGDRMTVRLRYAPSPTGHLHIGGARTALFNYLYAKHMGGAFILRIEDTDLERNVDKAADEFAKNLRWLGLEWDEGPDVGGDYGPYISTERLAIYGGYVLELRERGLAYACYCSEEELAAERESFLVKGEMPRYSGHCRHLTEAQVTAYEAMGRKPAVRFRVPDDQAVSFYDLVRGELSFEPSGLGGDFVIVKSNGISTYNFACVIDDHLMAITHVVRGEEHISNTPRQLFLYRAFGWEPPEFGHVSLILGPNGKKLSKRDESIVQFVEQYRDMGYLPSALFNYLALLGWSPGGEQEIFTKEELVQAFNLGRVHKSGAYFDAAKLAWMNGHYLRQLPDEELLPLARRLAGPLVQGLPFAVDDAWLTEWASLYQDKISHMSELPEMGRTFLVSLPDLDEEAKSMLNQETALVVVRAFLHLAEAMPAWSEDSVKPLFKLVQTETGRKGKDLFMPIRAAVMGQLHGPDLNRSLLLLGQKRVLERLQSVLE